MIRQHRGAGLPVPCKPSAARWAAVPTTILFLTLSAGARAEPAGTELPALQVTASRIEQDAADTLAAVSVITREQIERSQASSLPELLRGAAGIGVTTSGGLGTATSLFLRGTNSDHTLVLVDGVRVGSATTGMAALQDLAPEQIERIEIVRGPRSGIYGSEAIGGVIQIFTRGAGAATRPYASLGAGSERTYTSSAGISGRAGEGWYALGASSLNTRGFNACRGKPSPGGAGCFTDERDRDGYRNLSASLRAGQRLGARGEVDVHWLRAEGRSEFDGSFVNQGSFVQDVIGARLRGAPLDFWRVTLAGGRSRDESDNFLDGRRRSSFDTQRDSLSLQNDFIIPGDGTLSAGIDYAKDRVHSTTDYDVTSRDDTGVFVQYLGGIGALQLEAAWRSDDNEQFGRHDTGHAALGYRVTHALRASLSYGTAFKAPTFNQLYYPGYGNPALRPEESTSFEAGLDGRLAQGNWSLRAYRTRIDDLIAGFPVANIASARIAGLEAAMTKQWDGWTLAGNVSLLDPRNRAPGANHDKLLPRRAKHLLNLDLDRDWGALRTGLTLHAEGRRYDDTANRVALGGYATLDLRAEYRLARDWRLQARVANLFDKRYETAAFYNQPDRSVMVTLRWQPL